MRVNDIEMYYEIHGAGAPLVLIGGLNSDHMLFRTFISPLAARYRVIVFDNRGVGQSGKPDIPYTIEMMADDTAGLLAALGIEQAHILGVSMGGRIAVALTLQHPQLVKSLILVSTGVKRLKDEPMTWARRRVDLMLRLPWIRKGTPYYAVIRQRDASRNYDAMDRLSEIHAPTLILHGRQDKSALLPLAEAMQQGIPGAKMQTFPGGHLFFIFRQQPFLAAVTDFLDALDAQDKPSSPHSAPQND
jgi:pimeloyl-ACP methyl ester carboxylesterase